MSDIDELVRETFENEARGVPVPPFDELAFRRRVSEGRRRRGLRVAAALYGPFGEPAAAGGDGETSTTLRLPGPRGSVDLELSLDEGSSRLQTFILRPAPAR